MCLKDAIERLQMLKKMGVVGTQGVDTESVAFAIKIEDREEIEKRYI